jgi:hypothetical protein
MSWRKLWVLFTVIWVVVSGLNAGTILAFSPDEAEKAWRPIVIGIAVPVLLYGLGVLWDWTKKWRKPSQGSDRG